MFNNLSKMFFIFMLIFGTIITISANSWFSIWMGLEINLLSFIPLMIKNNNLMSSESSIKYFIIQALSSSIMLFFMISFMIINNFSFQITYFSELCPIIISLTLMLKMGTAPFHFWLPNVMEGINWNNNLILLTWQKIAPMLTLSYFYFNNLFIIFIILSILFGSIGGLNQISMRKIMAYSSINHMGWMISTLMFNEMLWILYFFMYSILTFSMIFFLNSLKIFYLNQLYSIFMNSNILKFIFSINLLSLGGLPPFLGFLPKWMVIQSLMLINQSMLIMFMIILTLITLFFYLRISFSAIILNYNSINWNINFNFKNFFFLFTSFLTAISLFSLFILLNYIFI